MPTTRCPPPTTTPTTGQAGSPAELVGSQEPSSHEEAEGLQKHLHPKRPAAHNSGGLRISGASPALAYVCVPCRRAEPGLPLPNTSPLPHGRCGLTDAGLTGFCAVARVRHM